MRIWCIKLKDWCYIIFMVWILFLIYITSRDMIQHRTQSVRITENSTVPTELLLDEKALRPGVSDTSFSTAKPNIGKQITNPKTIVWFNHPFWLKKYSQEMDFNKCTVQNCVLQKLPKTLTEFQKKSLIIFEHFLPRKAPKKFQSQIWVFLTHEPPTLTHILYKQKQWQGKFDWIMNYHRDSDIPFPYGKALRQEETYIPNLNYPEIYSNKTGFAVLIQSNCFARSRRAVYVEELIKYIPIAHYGRCGNKSCEGDRRIQEVRLNCHKALSHVYKFFLAFENTLCDDYTSEKYFNQLQNDNYFVPVVRGDPNVYKYLPKGTYIDTNDFESPKALAEYLLKVSSDERLYTSYLREKHRYTAVSERELYHKALCTMCEKLHTSKKTPQPRDIKAFLTGKCYEPKDLLLTNTTLIPL